MMYNPYNWKIEKNNDTDMKLDVFPKSMNPIKCILEEIGEVSNLIELKRIKSKKLEKELSETMIELEELMIIQDELLEKMRRK